MRPPAGPVAMRTRLLLLLLALSLGCSSTRTLTRPPSPRDLKELNQQLEGHEVEVHQTSGAVQVVNGGELSESGGFESGPRAKAQLTVPPEALQQLKSVSTGRGAIDGLLFGAGAGAIAATIIATSPCTKDPGAQSFCEGVRTASAVGSFIGAALIGATIGAVHGHRWTTDFVPEPAAPAK